MTMKLTRASMLPLGASKARSGAPRRLGWIAGLTGAAMALTAGVIPAVAMAISAPTIYHACVTNKTGAIKIVSASAACSTGQHKIAWNKVGPAGPPGPAGVPAVYSSFHHSTVFLGAGVHEYVTGTLALPNGKFLVNVTANTWANLTSSADVVYCILLDGTGTSVVGSYAALFDDGTGSGEGSFALTVATTVGGKMKYECADSTQQAYVRDVSMTATPIGTLHGTPAAMALAPAGPASQVPRLPKRLRWLAAQVARPSSVHH